MRKIILLAVMMVMTVSANALKYKSARSEALFLSDKMAYELSLTEEQYEAVYEINLDYFMALDVYDDLFGLCWERRNADLRLVLTAWQYEKFLALEYFYRPVQWVDDAWLFVIYDHYVKTRFFFERPQAYRTYKGGNSKLAADYYATRIAEKPANADHHHAPTAYGERTVNPDAAGRATEPRIVERPVTPTVSFPARSGGLGGPGGPGRGGLGGPIRR